MSRVLLVLLALLATPAFGQQSPCYWSGIYTKCFPTGGLFTGAAGVSFANASGQAVEIQAATPSSVYALVLPASQGAASTVLTNNGVGVLTWGTPAAAAVTSVSGTAPIVVSPTTGAAVVSITQAGAAGNGYVSSTDWNTFNGKVSATYPVPVASISGVIATASLSGVIATASLSGVVAVGNGGTGLATFSAGGVLIGSGTANVTTATGAGSSVLRIPDTGGAPAFGAVNLASAAAVTGKLPVANGGTGLATVPTGAVILGAGTSAVTTASGQANNVLIWNSATSAASFGAVQLASAAAVAGTLATANGGTGSASYAASYGPLYVGLGGTALVGMAAGTTSQVMVGGGVSAAPVWGAVPAAALPAATNTTAGAVKDRKQYVNGTAYTNGTPSLTSGQGGFSVTRGVYVPYQTTDGAWRLTFSAAFTITGVNPAAGAVTILVASLSGITSKNTTNFDQAFACMADSSSVMGGGGIAPYGSSTLKWSFVGATGGGSVSQFAIAGDIELDSKPTWAD